jgi:hypothetical protein
MKYASEREVRGLAETRRMAGHDAVLNACASHYGPACVMSKIDHCIE